MSAYGRIGAGRVTTPEETRERTRAALTAWRRGNYLATDDLAGRYFAERAIGWLAAKRFRNVLRWRPDAPHPSGVPIPAILCAVTDARENFRAVHRIFFKHERAEKFGAPLSLGPISGAAIRLASVADVLAAGQLIVGEGLETTASACALLKLPGWCAIACGNLGWSMVLPADIRNVVIAVDRDPPGMRAADAAALRWRAEGRAVDFLLPDRAGADANDVLRERAHG